MFKAKMLALVGAVFLALLVIVIGFAGIYTSNIIRDDGLLPMREEAEPDLVVLDVTDTTVTLGKANGTEEPKQWTHDGVFGLDGEVTYVRLGNIISESQEQVVREFSPIWDTPQVGEMASLDGGAFPENPLVAHGIDYENVTYSSPLGEFTAWLIPGDSETWAIAVHGHNGTKQEALRVVPPLTALGATVMVINYRNDEGQPSDPGGFHRYGLSEWQELDGAVSYAIGNGARNIVLVGFSMGGGIVMSWMYESQQADRATAIVLDSPMLDFGSTTDFNAKARGYPQVITSYAKAVAAMRFDVDWDGMNYISRSSVLQSPVLLFHGTGDERVPVQTSDMLAELRPDIVRLLKAPDAEHVRSWNQSPETYEAELRAFLLEALGE